MHIELDTDCEIGQTVFVPRGKHIDDEKLVPGQKRQPESWYPVSMEITDIRVTFKNNGNIEVLYYVKYNGKNFSVVPYGFLFATKNECQSKCDILTEMNAIAEKSECGLFNWDHLGKKWG